ncbi:MAG: methyltransferase domain-containing protein, partial [Myxococcales bacterium]|nr:methyltransferase domain-containing protein [Myxococcales bacterium]
MAHARRRHREPGVGSEPPDALPDDFGADADGLSQSDPVATSGRFDALPLKEPEPSLAGITPGGLDALATPPPGEGISVLPAGADPLWAHRALLEEIDRQTKGARRPTEGAWYADLFGRDYLLAYPERRPFATDPEADFVEASLGVAAGGRILDLACGYGRMAVPLGRRGYEVIGVDLNLEMLERGLGIVHRDKLPVKLVHGDMRDLKFDQVFDGACLLDTSLGFFSEVEDLAVLKGLLRALKRGGRLLLDLTNRDHLLDELPLRNWWEGDGCLIQEDVDFDHLTSRLMTKRFLVYADGT